MSLQPGARFGPYEIVTAVGAGGMGEVYRARDTRLGRDVAIKVLHGLAPPDPASRARVEQEARLIASLNHPHICALHDIGEQQGVPFLVMEYLEGETLAHRLGRGPLPAPDVLRYATEIARALEAAHRRGVVHRDLKPGNVMLTRAGAKLLDFGLAKDVPPDAPARWAADSTAPTSPGDRLLHTSMAGTLPYMSPEQLEGKPVDARSDIFAFGTMLYEMATARRAFHGDTPGQVIAAILLGHPAPMRRWQPEVPDSLERVVGTCVARDPDERWQNAGDLARALSWVAEGVVAAPPAVVPGAAAKRSGLRRRWLTAAAILLVLGVAGVASRRVLPSSSPPRHVVVLPCRSLGEGADTLLCDGVAETLTARLAELSSAHNLQVSPASEVRRARVADALEARERLGATLTLEGSLLRAGDTLRLNYALVDPRTHEQLDAVSLTSPASAPLRLQDSVVEWATRALRLQLSAQERETLHAHGTQAPEAFTLYQHGRGRLLQHQTLDDAMAAIHLFERTIAIDPGFALAHAALGEAAWAAYELSRDPEWVERARGACRRALEAQPALPEAHFCTGTVQLGTGEHAGAARAFQEAIRRRPTYDDAYVGLGRALQRMGDHAGAERTYRDAIARRPRYWAAYMWLGNLLRAQARHAEALAAYEQAAALNGGHPLPHARLGAVYMYMGRYDDAIAAFRRSVAATPTPAALMNWGVTLYRLRDFDAAAGMLTRACGMRESYGCFGDLARAYYFGGKRREARALLERAAALAAREIEVDPRSADARMSLAEFAAKLGRRDEALEHLRQVALGADPHMLFFAALVHVQVGDRAVALDWLRKAVDARLPPAELRAWPELDVLRSDPRFVSLASHARAD